MSGIGVALELDRESFRLDAAFEAPGSGATAIFGPSGSGKTTLLRAIAGLEPRARGRVEVLGERWQDPSGHFVPPHRRPLAFVFQTAALFPHLNVQENLQYGWQRVPPADRRLDLGQVTGWMGVEHLLRQMPATLSGGERQRVAIARALLAAPKLLLMDEPLAALDRQARFEILDRLDRLRNELDMPILYVSHSLDEVARLASYAVLIENGRITGSGAAGEVLSNLSLEPAHLREAATGILAKVAAHDEQDCLTRLEFDGGSLWAPRLRLQVGEPQRVTVHARDVALSLELPRESTVLNVLKAVIVEMREEGEAQVLVKAQAGETVLLARITRRSARTLSLQPGMRVYALIKSVALD